jgi:transcriptional regulator with XRE-family HTH domain
MFDLKMKIGKRIKELRLKKGFTQAELAETVNLSINFISYLENGKKAVSLKTLEKITNALNIDFTKFFNFNLSRPSLPSNAKKKQIEKLNLYLKNRSANQVGALYDMARKIFKKK